MSDNVKIYAAIVKAQAAYGPALKNKKNPHFGKNYADLAACAEAVTDALNQNGIALAQVCHENTDGVVVETKFLHESGEEWSGGRLFVPATKKDAQSFGSALSYARRYSLMAACGIAPEDDDGNAASAPAAPHAPVSDPKTVGPKPIDVTLLRKAVLKIDKADKLVDMWGTPEFVARYAVSDKPAVDAVFVERSKELEVM